LKAKKEITVVEPITRSIPWKWITEEHIKHFGYSGTVIRALRIQRNMTRDSLANKLRKRVSYIKKIETTDKIGIKLAKELAIIFSPEVTDWRLIREKK
jgi:ribosome-binding protein aMBF1 (putative translation factor)